MSPLTEENLFFVGIFSPDWSEDHLKTMYRHDLCNVYGNLVGRTISPKFRQALATARAHVCAVPHDLASCVSYSSLLEDQAGMYKADDQYLGHILRMVKSDVDQLMDEFEFGRALDRIQQCLMKVGHSFLCIASTHGS